MEKSLSRIVLLLLRHYLPCSGFGFSCFVWLRLWKETRREYSVRGGEVIRGAHAWWQWDGGDRASECPGKGQTLPILHQQHVQTRGHLHISGRVAPFSVWKTSVLSIPMCAEEMDPSSLESA